jgi:hypothetical protein
MSGIVVAPYVTSGYKETTFPMNGTPKWPSWMDNARLRNAAPGGPAQYKKYESEAAHREMHRDLFLADG